MSVIIVNDEKVEVTLPLSVLELLSLNNINQPEMVSVHINDQIIERDQFNETQINENDQIDILYFMGGGQ